MTQTFTSIAGQSSVITKRITAPIGACGEGVANLPTGFDLNQRQNIVLPVTTIRWRLRIRNYSLYNQTAYTGALTLAGAWIGKPDFTQLDPNGNNRIKCVFDGSQQQVLGSQSMTSDGSDWISPWVISPTFQFQQFGSYILSIGITSGANLNIPYSNAGVASWGTGSAAASGANAMPLAGASFFYNQYFDVRLEYEYQTPAVGGTRALMIIGDSIAYGGSMGPEEGQFPHEAWVTAAGLQTGFCTTNLSVTGMGAQTAAFQSTSSWFYTRADLTTTVPDCAVVALGTNDIAYSGATINTLLAALKTCVTTVRSLGIKQVGLATMISRFATASTQESVRQNVNDILRELPWGVQFLWDVDKALYLGATPAVGDMDLLGSQNLHPSIGGHQRMALGANLPRGT